MHRVLLGIFELRTLFNIVNLLRQTEIENCIDLQSITPKGAAKNFLSHF
jgi:hypothetical protein